MNLVKYIGNIVDNMVGNIVGNISNLLMVQEEEGRKDLGNTDQIESVASIKIQPISFSMKKL